MKYNLDIHTHTIASGHAYTTLLENIKEASGIGLRLLTDSKKLIGFLKNKGKLADLMLD